MEEITMVFDERVNGFTSFQTYVPTGGLSINNRHFTTSGGGIYEHNRDDVPRGSFYGNKTQAEIDVVFNDYNSAVKEFKTIGYEGQNNWRAEISTDQESSVIDSESIPNKLSVAATISGEEFTNKEGKFFAEIKGVYSGFSEPDLTKLSTSGLGSANVSGGTLSFNEGIIPPSARGSVTIDFVEYPGDRIWFYNRTSISGLPLTFGDTLRYAGEIATIDRETNSISVAVPITPGTPTPEVSGVRVPSNLLDPSLVSVLESTNRTARVFRNISQTVQNAVFGVTDFTDTAIWEEQNTSRVDGSLIEYRIPQISNFQDDDFFILIKDEGVETGGLKGFYSIVKMINNDNDTSELFSINSDVFISTI